MNVGDKIPAVLGVERADIAGDKGISLQNYS
jgi:hypothetical protein